MNVTVGLAKGGGAKCGVGKTSASRGESKAAARVRGDEHVFLIERLCAPDLTCGVLGKAA